MRYPFRCLSHTEDFTFEVTAPIAEGPPPVVNCPQCGERARRVYEAVTDIWYTQGAHKTD